MSNITRYKMDFVEFAYCDLFGDLVGVDVDRVHRALDELYEEYKGCRDMIS